MLSARSVLIPDPSNVGISAPQRLSCSSLPQVVRLRSLEDCAWLYRTFGSTQILWQILIFVANQEDRWLKLSLPQFLWNFRQMSSVVGQSSNTFGGRQANTSQAYHRPKWGADRTLIIRRFSLCRPPLATRRQASGFTRRWRLPSWAVKLTGNGRRALLVRTCHGRLGRSARRRLYVKVAGFHLKARRYRREKRKPVIVQIQCSTHEGIRRRGRSRTMFQKGHRKPTYDGPLLDG